MRVKYILTGRSISSTKWPSLCQDYLGPFVALLVTYIFPPCITWAQYLDLQGEERWAVRPLCVCSNEDHQSERGDRLVKQWDAFSRETSSVAVIGSIRLLPGFLSRLSNPGGLAENKCQFADVRPVSCLLLITVEGIKTALVQDRDRWP